MASIILFAVIILIMSTTGYKDLSVDRANHGIQFHHKDSLFITSAIWRQTFSIRLPPIQNCRFTQFANCSVINRGSKKADSALEHYELQAPASLQNYYRSCTGAKPSSDPCQSNVKYRKNMELLGIIANEQFNYLYETTRAMY